MLYSSRALLMYDMYDLYDFTMIPLAVSFDLAADCAVLAAPSIKLGG